MTLRYVFRYFVPETLLCDKKQVTFKQLTSTSKFSFFFDQSTELRGGECSVEHPAHRPGGDSGTPRYRDGGVEPVPGLSSPIQQQPEQELECSHHIISSLH